VEPQESLNACLERELKEELDMDVVVIRHFLTIQHNYEDFSLELISFLCDVKSSTFSMKDHDAYEWVDPILILDWNLAPADIPIAKALIEFTSSKHTTSRCWSPPKESRPSFSSAIRRSLLCSGGEPLP